MKAILTKLLAKLGSPFLSKLHMLENQIEQNRMLSAQILINLWKTVDLANLHQAEFRVFSQWGEDGIIQYLISKVPIENEIFVEFGVEDYRESNSRFLLMNNNWKGLIIDSNRTFIDKIKKSDLYWRYDLSAVDAFITRDNINQLIASNGITGDIGLLNIDIDGNDYWVWQAINVISPRVVICEYNSVFGPHEAVTIPYVERFNRTDAHHSNLYFGASLKALCLLAEQKGYVFVGSNSAGSNAFFVRRDCSSNVRALDHITGYVKSKCRESRNESGTLNYVSGDDRIRIIQHLQVVDVQTNTIKFIKDVIT